MWGRVNRVDATVALWKDMCQREEKKALQYQAWLYHAWKALREHQKGMQRQARRMKRLRAENERLQAMLVYAVLKPASPLSVVSHDFECEHAPAFQKTVTTNSGTVTICETCSESRFTPWQAEASGGTR